VVNSEWKEEDLFIDKVFKYLNTGMGAIDLKLCSLCLVVLGCSGCHCGWVKHQKKEVEAG
jgi:hypothetical protein